MYPLHQSKASPRPTRSLLVDGYIAYTLQPPAAASTYLLRLLSSTTADRLQPIFNQRAILIRRTCLRYNSRETDDTQEIVLLDYLVDPTTGTVVPQKLPSLVGAGAGEHQRLHVPFFFSQSNSGTLGLALSAAFSPDESSSSSSIRRDGAVLLDNAILVLNWPGYPEYARTQANWDTRSGCPNMKQLFAQVAFFLASFLEDPPAKPATNDDEHGQWVVGPAWKEYIILVGLLHVSSTPNVWMPIIQLHGLFRVY